MILNINNQAIFAFSDTHGNHHKLQVPDNADIIICAGDAVEDDLNGGEYDGFIKKYFKGNKREFMMRGIEFMDVNKDLISVDYYNDDNIILKNMDIMQ